MTETSKIDPEYLARDGFPAIEVKRLCHYARTDALREAVILEHELGAPSLPDRITACPHRGHEDCDCPKPTGVEYEGMVRLVEEATVERVMRNAERFYEWIFYGVTPGHARDFELRAMQGGEDVAS